jgi:hypothetical protein
VIIHAENPNFARLGHLALLASLWCCHSSFFGPASLTVT